MAQQDKTRLLLSMQEHPERYTDGQLEKMLADDRELAQLWQQLVTTKRAFARKEAEQEPLPIDDLWEKFSTEHAGELNALGSSEEQTVPTAKAPLARIFAIGSRMRKIAAVIISILCIAGMAVAAVHLWNALPEKSMRQPANEEPTEHVQQNDSAGTKPVVPAEPTEDDGEAASTVFDNVALGNMLAKIATYYNKVVEFQNEDLRPLRFYFEWNHDETLDHVVKRLNHFESIEINVSDEKIIVK